MVTGPDDDERSDAAMGVVEAAEGQTGAARELAERFDMRPVAPSAVQARFDAGERLVTMDLQGHLGRKMALDVETGTALYRLVQLFGTPNVGGLEAGADQPERVQVTWRYLLEVTDDDGRSLLLSVYDYRTDVSTGLSAFVPADGDGRPAPEPVEYPPDGLDVPEESLLVGLVELVLNVLEEPVPATFRELWV